MRQDNRAKKGLLLALIAVLVFVLAGITACTPGGTDIPQDLPEQQVSFSPNQTDNTPAPTPSDWVQPDPAPTPEPTPKPAETPPAEQTPAPTEPAVLPEQSSFEIHFIDVGQADAALVLCDGKAMLIDGGNSQDSSLIYSYLKTRSISYLDYIVATHGHEDHVGGLSGALNYATVGTALCPVTHYDSRAFESFTKYLSAQNKSITVPNVGDQFSLGSASVQIVGVNSSTADHNDTSIVLRIVYGSTSFLFTGDAEREAEQVILNSGYPLESTVLKVGHHGSASSTGYVFLREVMPKHAVISVGADNDYGHPTDAALSRLRDAGVAVYRTDLQGTVICTSDGSEVFFRTQRNPDADTLSAGTAPAPTPEPTPTPAPDPTPDVPSPAGTDYVGNKNSHKFHYSWCSSVNDMKESNKYYYTGTRDEMISMGYTPCKNCNP